MAGSGVFFLLIFLLAAFVSYVERECGKTFARRVNLWDFKLLSRALLCNTTCTRLVMVPIRMHRTSEEEQKSAPFIRYSFANGLAEPLLQRGKGEQEQEGAKITWKSDSPKYTLIVITAKSWPVVCDKSSGYVGPGPVIMGNAYDD
jgi:hypothetical protein